MSNLVNDKQLQMRVTKAFIDELNDWRRKQPKIPSRSEAIRTLVTVGIKTLTAQETK